MHVETDRSPQRTRLFAGALLLILAVSLPGTSQAAWSTLGGKLLRADDRVLTAGVGLPDIFAQYNFGSTSSFNPAIKGEFFYSASGLHLGDAIGFGVSAPMRFAIMDQGEFRLAVKVEPGLLLNFANNVALGFRFGLGLPMSLSVDRRINILFGINMPMGLLLIFAGKTYVAFYLPIHFGFGVEVKLKRDWAVFAMAEGGPVIYAGDGWYSGVGGDFAFHMGLQKRL